MSSTVFVEANPPEILRSIQKDESYINHIKTELADIVQRLFGKLTIENNNLIVVHHAIDFLIE